MTIEFIIPTFNRVNPLFSMIASLMAQNNPNWKANVVIDDCNKNDAEGVVKMFNDTRVSYTYMDKRYNDFGHTPREYGKQNSDADYIIMTGDDNYYVPVFVGELLKKIKEENNPVMVYWDMVHSFYNYTYFKCKPFNSQIDMGAFAVRSDVAKKIELQKTYAADGIFAEYIRGNYLKEGIVKINKVLFVHN